MIQIEQLRQGAGADELLQKAYAEFVERGTSVRVNVTGTSLQLQECVFCGNPKWNLDIELTEKFVFSCWACGRSGTAARLFVWLKLLTRPPVPDGVSGSMICLSPKTEIYLNYPFGFKDYELVPAAESFNCKVIAKERPLYFQGKKIDRGIMILGQLGNGVLVVDADTRLVRKTAPDVFLYRPKLDHDTLAVVEGYWDVFPYFAKTTTLILGGSYIPHSILPDFAGKLSPARVLIALDQHAEKSFFRQSEELFPNAEKIVLFPERHSPAGSKYLRATKIQF